MKNKMIKLLTAVGGLLLLTPLAFAGSEPNPGVELVDGKPIIKRVRLSITPAVPACGGGYSGLSYTGVGCLFGDLTIVGKCKGVVVSAGLREFPLEALGLDSENEDITDITKKGLRGRVLELGDQLALQNPGLDNVCPVSGRKYKIIDVEEFRNKHGLISAKFKLAPQD